MVGNVTIGARVSVSGRDGENGTAWRGVLQHHHLKSSRKYSRPSFSAALLSPLAYELEVSPMNCTWHPAKNHIPQHRNKNCPPSPFSSLGCSSQDLGSWPKIGDTSHPFLHQPQHLAQSSHLSASVILLQQEQSQARAWGHPERVGTW